MLKNTITQQIKLYYRHLFKISDLCIYRSNKEVSRLLVKIRNFEGRIEAAIIIY